MPANRAENNFAIGPGPLRTARGAGLLLLVLARVEDLFRVWLPVARVLDLAAVEPVRFALLVRDAEGEDIRVAML